MASVSGRARVLFVSYSPSGTIGYRIFTTILKDFYDLAFLNIMDLSDRRSTFREPELQLGLIAEFCKDFDYVLFSTTRYHASLTFQMADAIKKANSETTTIVGGPHAILNPAQCLEHADYVCIFEGEGILELLQCLDSGEERRSIGNFVCKSEDLDRPFDWVKDLNTLELVEYRSAESFWYTPSGIVQEEHLPRIIYYQSVRGCPHQCEFCSNAPFNLLKSKHSIPAVRFKNMDTILEELRHIGEQLPKLESVDFSPDDNFFSRNLEEFQELAERYDAEVGIPVILLGDLRSKEFEPKIRALSKIKSLKSLDFGIQSGSEEFRSKVYKRFHSNETILSKHLLMRELFGRDFPIRYDLIYGHPEEQAVDLEETLNLMLQLKGAKFSTFHFTPVPSDMCPVAMKADLRRSYSNINPEQMAKYPYYYFLLFLTKHMREYGLNALLPETFKPNKMTRALNSPLFRVVSNPFIRVSIWVGMKRLKRKTPHGVIA